MRRTGSPGDGPVGPFSPPRPGGIQPGVLARLASRHGSYDGAASRARVRVGFALTHPTVVAGLVADPSPSVGAVGAALLALHGLVELQWHLADRAEPAGIPARAVYTGPS